jgi:hypothetical protein
MPIAAVLGALTLLEARRLVVSAYGRYRPTGRLAAEPTSAPRKIVGRARRSTPA